MVAGGARIGTMGFVALRKYGSQFQAMGPEMIGLAARRSGSQGNHGRAHVRPTHAKRLVQRPFGAVIQELMGSDYRCQTISVPNPGHYPKDVCVVEGPVCCDEFRSWREAVLFYGVPTDPICDETV